jgi:hypothetical protein
VDALIGSTTGRSKLSQLLLALLVSEPKFSYIQGMDSLAAVCLKLFYVSPPRALLLLRAVINRFLGKVVYKVCNLHHQVQGYTQHTIHTPTPPQTLTPPCPSPPSAAVATGCCCVCAASMPASRACGLMWPVD